MLLKLLLGGGLEGANIAGELPGVLAPFLASESLATGQDMPGAYYLGREVTVALVDEPRHAPGSLLRQHKVLVDGLDHQVIRPAISVAFFRQSLGRLAVMLKYSSVQAIENMKSRGESQAAWQRSVEGLRGGQRRDLKW